MEFARGLGVSVSALRWWSWKLGSTRRRGKSSKTTSVSPLTFVEMTVSVTIVVRKSGYCAVSVRYSKPAGAPVLTTGGLARRAAREARGVEGELAAIRRWDQTRAQLEERSARRERTPPPSEGARSRGPDIRSIMRGPSSPEIFVAPALIRCPGATNHLTIA
jgi:hypothetical protein